ncbi:hypothetical protein B0H17DRAFT_1042654 [Mycena rosella]|uniref:Uncharacterized protein n=1 Tax=Mycena rosella TaxID=1033263 RepID=A0AAD7DZG5_MYCRO|nr:hypothetical protein B0H17DRAFT_1042654 [Mycena rosella]
MPERTGPGFTLTFGGLLASVMIALKLKEGLDDYKQVSTDEEGRVALGGPPPVYRDQQDIDGDDAEAISLINTEIRVARPKRQRAKCCVCCGLNCGLFWKAFGIVVAIFAVWNAFKLIRWAVTPSPTGLEDMPEFSTSLGCVSAPYIYTGAPVAFSVAVGTQNADHGLDVRGGAVGTIIVLEGAPTATEIKYEVTVRTDDEALLDDLQVPTPENPGTKKSRAIISTPHPAEGKCMRYDLKIFVPPNLKKLHVASHAIAHVQFDPESHIQLDDFFVTLFASSDQNIILPHNNLRAHQMSLEIYEGWIVGDAAIVSSTKITTQRGHGIMNVRVHPTDPVDPESPEVAQLRTTSGSGRTDVFYVDHDADVHRPISSVHLSSMNADMYLTYRDAHFTGLVQLDSTSYTATGLQPLAPVEKHDKWTHWAGDKEGKDEIQVNSRKWVGLYF